MNKIALYIKHPLFVLIIVSLFLPRPAFAFFGTGLFDFFNHLMDGVGERTGPMFQYVLSGLILYAIAIFSLFISSRILENFITAQGDWIASLNDVTQAGWDFVAGLSNMLLIVILIIIAFAFIFKIETFQAKKALPRLIGVALLINFSLLFVKMLVDIFQVLYNTVLPDESLFTLVIDTLIGPSSAVISTVAGWLFAAGAAWSIPFANAFAQIAFSAALTVLILPNIIMWAIQAVFSYILAGMFFFFILLFGARVFVLTLLMILSPLAFVCLILPQTKSFWSKWFKTLLEWLLLGVYFLFFLYLGFSAIEVLAPEGLTVAGVDVSLLPLGSFGSIGGYIIYYLGVFIYMAVILMIGKQFIPQGAQAMIDFGKGIAGTVLTRGLMPVGKGAVAQMRQAAVQQRSEEGRRKAEAAARGEEYAPKLWRRAALATTGGTVRFFHRVTGTTPELETSKEVERKAKDIEQKFGKDTASAMAVFPPWKLADASSKSAMALYLQKMYGGDTKGLGRLSSPQLKEAIGITANLAPHRVEDIVRHKPELIDDKEIGKLIQNTMVSKGVRQKDGTYEDKDIQAMANSKIKIGKDKKNIEELIETDAGKIEVIRAAAMKKAVDAMKSDDIGNLSIDTISNPGFQEMVARFKDVNFIRKIGEEKGSEYIQAIAEQVTGNVEEIYKTNRTLLSSTIHNPGFSAVFPLGEETKEKIKNLIGGKNTTTTTSTTATTTKTKLTPGTEEEFRKALEERRKREQKQ